MSAAAVMAAVTDDGNHFRHCEERSDEAIHAAASGEMDCFAPLAMTEPMKLAAPRQPPHHLVELVEAAVTDLHGTAGIAMIDVDVQPERIGDAFLQRDR